MSGLSKRDIEALLGGRGPDGLEQLAGLIERVRQEASAPVDPAVASRHIAAAAIAARQTPVPTPAPVSTARRTWRRRTVFAGVLSTIFGKLFMGAVALAAVTAGAGAAGVLPDPVQGFIDGNEEVHQLLDQIREQEQAQLHEQEPMGDMQQIRDQDRVRLQDGEPPVESNGYSNEFLNQFQNQGEESPGPNQFQHEFEHQNRLGDPAGDPNEYMFQYQHSFQSMYRDGDETNDTTGPQMHQQEHQQGIDQGANTAVPQTQQQTQQQGLSEDSEDPIDQQQQQQPSPDETPGSTGPSQDGPGGFGRP